MKFADVKAGTIINVADTEFIVLEKKNDCIVCLTKNFLCKSKFDSNSNNYTDSSIRKSLNSKFLSKLEKAVGAENIFDTEIDLISDDGLDDYGKVTDKVGLLTCDMYRKYSRIIEKYPANDWWWLATPYSTKSNGYRYSVRCVCNNGTLYYYNCNYDSGVRPFCIFSSAIFES